MLMRTYASSRVRGKSFIEKVNSRCFFFNSGGHIGAPKRCTNMASPNKALQRCVKRFDKKLRNYGPQRPETWTFCLYIGLFITFHFLGFFHWTVSNLIVCCMIVKTIYNDFNSPTFYFKLKLFIED